MHAFKYIKLHLARFIYIIIQILWDLETTLSFTNKFNYTECVYWNSGY